MKWLKRLFGICETPMAEDEQAWSVQDGVVRIDLIRMRELKDAGSGVRLEGKGLAPRLLVFHGDDGRYHAVANRCTHMGRRIDLVPDGGVMQCCSVSKSTFTYDGQPVGGAAKKALSTFPVSVDKDTLTIRLAESRDD